MCYRARPGGTLACFIALGMLITFEYFRPVMSDKSKRHKLRMPTILLKKKNKLNILNRKFIFKATKFIASAKNVTQIPCKGNRIQQLKVHIKDNDKGELHAVVEVLFLGVLFQNKVSPVGPVPFVNPLLPAPYSETSSMHLASIFRCSCEEPSPIPPRQDSRREGGLDDMFPSWLSASPSCG